MNSTTSSESSSESLIHKNYENAISCCFLIPPQIFRLLEVLHKICLVLISINCFRT